MTGFGLYHSCAINMNITNRNQSLVKNEIRHNFIRLTICNIIKKSYTCFSQIRNIISLPATHLLEMLSRTKTSLTDWSLKCTSTKWKSAHAGNQTWYLSVKNERASVWTKRGASCQVYNTNPPCDNMTHCWLIQLWTQVMGLECVQGGGG